MKRPMWWRTAALASVAALTLAACAGDDDDAPAEEAPPVEEEDAPAAPAFEGTLDVGVILPQSGQLAFLGPPMFSGIDLALAEINEAGGVWGNDVVLNIVDEGDPETPDVAVTNANTLIRDDVDAVIGAAASGMTVNILEAFRDAQIIQVSPSNTGVPLDEHPARDYYMRTAPSDVMQGTVLAEEILADGHETVSILARQDAYGEGLAAQTQAVYEAGGGEVVGGAPIIYDPTAADFDSEVSAVASADPDAIVIISFEEGERIMNGLAEGGLGVADGKQWFLVDGNHDEWGDTFPEGTLDGVKATAPTPADEPEAFYAQMDAFVEEQGQEELSTYIYGPESYDALMLIALGAVAADTDDPDARRAAMIEASRAPGTACRGFVECRDLIVAGEDVDYQGASGPVNWSDVGDPIQSTIGIYNYNAENLYELDRVEATQLD
jgi:ABC-type branched-subunit amino acid transport system substrate-binding protein